MLLIDRASGEAGRHLIAVDLASGDAPILDVAYEEPVEIEGGILRFGTLERQTRSRADLAGVDCPQGEDFLENGLDVGIVRVIEFDIASKERRDTDTRVCIPLD